MFFFGLVTYFSVLKRSEAAHLPLLLCLPFGLSLIQRRPDSFYLGRHLETSFLISILVSVCIFIDCVSLKAEDFLKHKAEVLC